MSNQTEMQDKLRRYAELKRMEKEVSESIDELKPDILAFLGEQKVDKLPTSLGTFSVSPKTTWKYSKAVEKLQEKEKAEGIAEQVVSYSLRFTPPKEEKQDE